MRGSRVDDEHVFSSDRLLSSELFPVCYLGIFEVVSLW